MFNKRLIFVTGKGGVGKTTISSAMAVAASKLGKKVLLVDVGGDDALAAGFGKDTIGHTPKEIYSLISAVRVDPRMAVNEYVHTFIKNQFIANRITRNRLLDYLATGTPGLREIMTLGKIWLWEQERDAASDAYHYDLIIVDAPAAGHGLSFLQVPQVLMDMIGIGPIKSQTEAVLGLLQHRKKTSLYLVTLPEELPVIETIQIYKAAAEVLAMPVGWVFINACHPKAFTTRESLEIKRRLRALRRDASNTGFLPTVLLSARIAIGRRVQQDHYVKRLKESIKAQFVEIPFRRSDVVAVCYLEEMAEELLRSVPT
ncbi:MAG: ArsA family ATPase [Acidobacteria bacterium]|nr:ArsA family ATPase [Acidobacteriota bacterium]MBI3658347.1 ArsA family ATPase [Acidobacteriota bacterium]